MKIINNKYTRFIYNKMLGLTPKKNNKTYGFKFKENPDTKASGYEFFIDKDNLLIRLSDKYKLTKRIHNYLIYYWNNFRDIRCSVKNVLEIGVQTGNSLLLWEEFFPNADVYGIDIDPQCKKLESGRKKIRIGDQSDDQFLQEVVTDAGGYFDIIIDDGSHRPLHQLGSFNYLFPYLSEDGIYVIEDTGGCTGDFQLM